MFCKQCGAFVPDGYEFCPKCGSRASDLFDDLKSEPVRPRKKFRFLNLILPSGWFSLAGRIPRLEFVLRQILLIGCLAAAQYASLYFQEGGGSHEGAAGKAPIIVTFVILALFYSNFAVWVKRLHDLNLSAWWTVLLYMAALGLETYIQGWAVLVPLVLLSVLPGNMGSNRYGPDTRG